MELMAVQEHNRTYTMEVTSWNTQHGSYLIEPTPWKVPSGTYNMELSSWNLQHGEYLVELTPGSLPHGTYSMDVT